MTMLYWILVPLCFHVFAASALFSQSPIIGASVSSIQDLEFSREWHFLGPFRIGTREATWGADPLESFGGFRNLPVDVNASFPSPLVVNATVKWASHVVPSVATQSSLSANLFLNYPEVDWNAARNEYGWAALQYQAWTRGSIFNKGASPVRVKLYPTNILEFYIGDQHVFGGDFFGFERAPLVADITPGINIINVRFIRDIRASGGVGDPSVSGKLVVEPTAGSLTVLESGMIVPNIVDGHLSGSYFSAILCNEQRDHVEVIAVSTNALHVKVSFVSDKSVIFAPGQSRPLGLKIFVDGIVADDISINLKLRIIYDSREGTAEGKIDFKLSHVQKYLPHKMTFLHPSGAVSYAIIRPPAENITSKSCLPVLLGLHGAGVEADSDQLKHSLDATSDLATWLVFPTGMSPWSGDDWHSWGLSDALSAVNAIAGWIDAVQWTGPGFRADRIMIIGHSNGGQGTWYFASHQPDVVVAAAPASGYTSIQNYVPYSLWAETDPLKTAVITASLNRFRNELLLENIVHKPLLVQHGSADDNVPPYHSRLMYSLRTQLGLETNYFELAGRPHWFDGVMVTPQLLDFYRRHLHEIHDTIEIPLTFTFVCPNSNDLGSMFGIVVDQLSNPGRLGRIEMVSTVVNGSLVWHLTTSNIHRLHFDLGTRFSNPPHFIHLDSTSSPVQLSRVHITTTFVISEEGAWHEDLSQQWRDLSQRYGRQRGALDALMATQGTFHVIALSQGTMTFALQASRNMLQYFLADSALFLKDDYLTALEGPGNVITFAIGQDIPPSKLDGYPIQVTASMLSIRDASGQLKTVPCSAGMGGIWLRPLEHERVELFVWGSDLAGLQLAARLVPSMTGAGQPDFVVVGNQGKSHGHAAALMMGFLDFSWNVSTFSYI